MNKIKKFFYDRTKKHLVDDAFEKGLDVIDEVKWEKLIKKGVKSDMLGAVLFILLIGYVIWSWVT